MIFVGCCFQVTDVNAHIPALCAVTVHTPEQHPEWAFTGQALVSDSPHVCMCVQIMCASSCVCVMMSVAVICMLLQDSMGRVTLRLKGLASNFKNTQTQFNKLIISLCTRIRLITWVAVCRQVSQLPRS